MATSDIATKLNYLMDTKEIIRNTIVEKGVDCGTTVPFRDYAQKIATIQTGSGGGVVANLFNTESIWEDDTSFNMESDVVLKDGITLDDFETTDNIDSITQIDNLNFNVVMKEALKLNDKIEITATKDAYKNKNGTSLKFVKYVTLPTFDDYIGDNRHMAIVRDKVKSNGSTDNIIENGWTYAVTSESTIIVTSPAPNSLKFTTTIRIANRDNSSYSIWKYIADDFEHPFIKIRWLGFMPYNVAVANLEWELFIFNDYNYFINGIVFKDTQTDAVSKMFDTTFNFKSDNPQISFYRNNFYNRTYDVVYDKFDFDLSKQYYDSFWHHCNMSDIVGVYEGFDDRSVYKFLENKRTDSTVGTFNWYGFEYFPLYQVGKDNAFVDFKTFYVYGDSVIRPNSNTNYDIDYNKRNSSCWYLYAQLITLDDFNGLKACRLIWGGSTQYNGALDQWWEVWFFENGDGMMYIKQKGNYYATNVNKWMGITLSTTIEEGDYVSFYRDDTQDNGWNIVYDKYHID